MQSIENENWLVVVSFKTELLSEAIIHKGYRESLPKLLPQIPKFINRMIIDNDIYIDLAETGKIQEYFSTDIISRASGAYEIIENQSKKFIETSRKVVKKLKNLSNTELSERLDIFFKEYQKTVGAIGVPTIIDLAIESKLRLILKESHIGNIDNTLSKLAIPYKPVETSKEKEELLILAKEIKNKKFTLASKETKLLIKKHFNKYGWLHSTLFLGNLYDESQITKEVGKILEKTDEDKKRLEQDRKKYLSEAEKIIYKIKSKEGKKLAKFFQRAVYYRTARLEWMNKACFIAISLLENVSKKLGIEFDDLIYLLPEEITDCLYKNKRTDKLIAFIKERRKGYAYISDNKNEYLLITGSELERWKKRFSETHETGGELLKGIATFKGKVIGRVVIVKDRSELIKVEKGDILVTRLTTPDFIIAMKKVSGVVTDIGGITSHAAITSRELKIPCIVGTKNATKVLKDGIMVELDANNGIVKIL